MVKTNTDLEKQLLNHLQHIAIELGAEENRVRNLDVWSLQDIITKDIHIARILRERDRKELKKLQRELSLARQTVAPFAKHMGRYN